MAIEKIVGRFQILHESTAIIYHDNVFTYEWLYNQITELSKRFREQMQCGSVVQLIADFSPAAIATFFALAMNKMIVSILTKPSEAKRAEYEKFVNAEYVIQVNHDDIFIKSSGTTCDHTLIQELRRKNNPGLIILSSGSTGKSKAIVHDIKQLLSDINQHSKSYHTIAFLLFDHIGGLNTLFQTLNNSGALVIPRTRTPIEICKSIANHQVHALVTSPSFLNLMLLTPDIAHYDLSSLKIINYGSEPMPEFLLKKLTNAFPYVRFSQAYGMSELGVLKARSKSSDSVYIKIDPSISFRVRDGLLEIRSKSSMLGYLGAPSPFTEDGWLKTNDQVEMDGEYIKILGRDSEVINVGGEKVYPAEVENVLMEMNEIEDAMVLGEKHLILGTIVKAKIKLKNNTIISDIRKRVRTYCSSKLDKFKIPQKIELIDYFTHNERYKKIRRPIT